MKTTTSLSAVIVFVCVFGLPLVARAQSEEVRLANEARDIVVQFTSTLKPRLLSAIEEGGLEHAVEVCASEAPQIAAMLALESGWDVKRVSLRARNSSLATPDAFERQVLEQFDAQQKNGEAAENMVYSRIEANQFRFLKAQGTEGLCLNCHGTSLSPALVSVLDRLYPDDQARGYALGEIRGAISLRHALDSQHLLEDK